MHRRRWCSLGEVNSFILASSSSYQPGRLIPVVRGIYSTSASSTAGERTEQRLYVDERNHLEDVRAEEEDKAIREMLKQQATLRGRQEGKWMSLFPYAKRSGTISSATEDEKEEEGTTSPSFSKQEILYSMLRQLSTFPSRVPGDMRRLKSELFRSLSLPSSSSYVNTQQQSTEDERDLSQKQSETNGGDDRGEQQRELAIRSVDKIVEQDSKFLQEEFSSLGYKRRLHLVPPSGLTSIVIMVPGNAWKSIKVALLCAISFPVAPFLSSSSMPQFGKLGEEEQGGKGDRLGKVFFRNGLFQLPLSLLKGLSAATFYLFLGFVVSPLYHTPLGLKNFAVSLRSASPEGVGDRSISGAQYTRFDYATGRYVPINRANLKENAAEFRTQIRRLSAAGESEFQYTIEVRRSTPAWIRHAEIYDKFLGGGGARKQQPGSSGQAGSGGVGSQVTKSPYEILNVASSVSDEELKRSYKKLLVTMHPDQRMAREKKYPNDDSKNNSTTERVEKQQEKRFNRDFFELQEAYRMIDTPEKRRSYDLSGAVKLEFYKAIDVPEHILRGTPHEIITRVFGGRPWESLFVGQRQGTQYTQQFMSESLIPIIDNETILFCRLNLLAIKLGDFIALHSKDEKYTSPLPLQERSASASVADKEEAGLMPAEKKKKTPTTTVASSSFNSSASRDPFSIRKQPPTSKASSHSTTSSSSGAGGGRTTRNTASNATGTQSSSFFSKSSARLTQQKKQQQQFASQVWGELDPKMLLSPEYKSRCEKLVQLLASTSFGPELCYFTGDLMVLSCDWLRGEKTGAQNIANFKSALHTQNKSVGAAHDKDMNELIVNAKIQGARSIHDVNFDPFADWSHQRKLRHQIRRCVDQEFGMLCVELCSNIPELCRLVVNEEVTPSSSSTTMTVGSQPGQQQQQGNNTTENPNQAYWKEREKRIDALEYLAKLMKYRGFNYFDRDDAYRMKQLKEVAARKVNLSPLPVEIFKPW